MALFPRLVLVRRYTNWTPRMRHNRTQKNGTRHSWDFRGTSGWNIGVALHHYQCHTIVAKATIVTQVSHTVEFINHHLTHATVTPMDRIVHGVTTLTWSGNAKTMEIFHGFYPGIYIYMNANKPKIVNLPLFPHKFPSNNCSRSLAS